MKNKEIFIDNIYIPTQVSERGTVVAVGSFDGVHLGHKSMLDALSEEAKKRNMAAVVVTFDVGNSPKSGFGSLAEESNKQELLLKHGADCIISLPFCELKDVSASVFAKDFLFEKLGARVIVCGYDFRFGKDREGNIDFLKENLSQYGVEFVTPKVVTVDETPISSTTIRNAVANGDFAVANRLLGHNFSFRAEIIKGKQLGRTLGFPTINQKFPETLTVPRFGVYAVKVSLCGKTYNGVANFGIKPTVSSDSEPICETYIFDYNGDCYGEIATTSFVSMIREEKKFSSLEELRIQVESDKITALNVLSKGE